MTLQPRRPFTRGEYGHVLEVVFTRDDGAPLDLTGGAAVLVWQCRTDLRSPPTAVVERPAAVIDALAGVAGYVFAAGDLDVAGHYEAAMWVLSAGRRVAEPIRWRVAPTAAVPLAAPPASTRYLDETGAGADVFALEDATGYYLQEA